MRSTCRSLLVGVLITLSACCWISPLYSYFSFPPCATGMESVERKFKAMQISCFPSKILHKFSITWWFLCQAIFTMMVVKCWFFHAKMSCSCNCFRPTNRNESINHFEEGRKMSIENAIWYLSIYWVHGFLVFNSLPFLTVLAFQIGYCVLVTCPDVLITSLLSCVKSCSKLILFLLCLSPGSSHFPEKPQFLFLEIDVKRPRSGC